MSLSPRYCGIDLRSLALLRIVLGAIQVGYLWQRLPELHIWFTDVGVLPREWLRHLIYRDGTMWSLYFMDGSFVWALAVWSVHLIAATLMILGWKTRWVVLLCLVCTWSLHVRNPFILTAGDILLRVLLAWLVLLPCHVRWSVDARSRRGKASAVRTETSWAAAGIIAQLTCLYFFAGIAKCNDDWYSGRATEMALQLQIHVTPFGERLLNWPQMLAVVTWGTLAMELAAPLLMWSPWKTGLCRLLAAIVFIALHLSVGLTMSVGWFSVIAVAAWTALIPNEWWDRWLSDTPGAAANGKEAARSKRNPGTAFWNRCGAALLVFTLAVNLIAAVPAIRDHPLAILLRRAANVLMVAQEFRMFGTPPRVSPAFDYAGKTEQGLRIDPFLQGMPLEAAREKSPFQRIGGHAWRRYHWHLVIQPGAELSTNERAVIEQLRNRLLAVVVERNPSQTLPGQRVVSAELTCRLTPIRVPRDPQVPSVHERWALWSAR